MILKRDAVECSTKFAPSPVSVIVVIAVVPVQVLAVIDWYAAVALFSVTLSELIDFALELV